MHCIAERVQASLRMHQFAEAVGSKGTLEVIAVALAPGVLGCAARAVAARPSRCRHYVELADMSRAALPEMDVAPADRKVLAAVHEHAQVLLRPPRGPADRVAGHRQGARVGVLLQRGVGRRPVQAGVECLLWCGGQKHYCGGANCSVAMKRLQQLGRNAAGKLSELRGKRNVTLNDEALQVRACGAAAAELKYLKLSGAKHLPQWTLKIIFANIIIACCGGLMQRRAGGGRAGQHQGVAGGDGGGAAEVASLRRRHREAPGPSILICAATTWLAMLTAQTVQGAAAHSGQQDGEEGWRWDGQLALRVRVAFIHRCCGYSRCSKAFSKCGRLQLDLGQLTVNHFMKVHERSGVLMEKLLEEDFVVRPPCSMRAVY